jgi:hypothetical protein
MSFAPFSLVFRNDVQRDTIYNKISEVITEVYLFYYLLKYSLYMNIDLEYQLTNNKMRFNLFTIVYFLANLMIYLYKKINYFL